jgi:hypothetical protein
LPSFLVNPCLPLFERDKILDEVEEPGGSARSLDQGIEADDARLLFVVDPLPLVEEFKRRVGRAKHRVEPVRENNERVGREDMRDCRAVVGQIAVVCVGHRPMARLELDEEKRQPVDEADEVGALGVKFAREPNLACEEEVVRFRVVPIDDADGFGDARTFGSAYLDFDAVADEFVNFGVGANGVDGAPVTHKRRVGFVERRVRQGPVEAL